MVFFIDQLKRVKGKAMAIRIATEDEVREILNCSIDVFKEATVGVVETAEQAMSMREPFLLSEGYYLVFVEDEHILGWIGICEAFDLYSNEVVGYLSEWYVEKEHRNKGIGKLLFQEALHRLKQDGFKKVQLNVFAHNRMKKYYEKLGFQDVAILMEKKIDENDLSD